jgi:hypothetical protein
VQTQKSNQGEGGSRWQHWVLAFNGGNEQWCLRVLAMDNNETMGNRHSMDMVMDYGKEVAQQRC